MISPHSPNGTKIVCIDNDPKKYDYRSNIIYDMNGLTENQVYTVGGFAPTFVCKSGFIVFLCEISLTRGFDIARFNYLNLPKCLTDIFDKVPSSKNKKKILEEV